MTEYKPPSNVPIGIVVEGFPVPENNISPKMIECYSLRRTTKILCGIDIFFGIMYSLYNPIFFIPTIMAIGGYYGAKYYHACSVATYLVFVTFDWITKLGFFIYSWSLLDPVDQSNSSFMWFFIIFSTIVDMWITKIVFKFWRCLTTIPVLELNQLRTLQLERHRFVYW